MLVCRFFKNSASGGFCTYSTYFTRSTYCTYSTRLHIGRLVLTTHWNAPHTRHTLLLTVQLSLYLNLLPAQGNLALKSWHLVRRCYPQPTNQTINHLTAIHIRMGSMGTTTNTPRAHEKNVKTIFFIFSLDSFPCTPSALVQWIDTKASQPWPITKLLCLPQKLNWQYGCFDKPFLSSIWKPAFSHHKSHEWYSKAEQWIDEYRANGLTEFWEILGAPQWDLRPIKTFGYISHHCGLIQFLANESAS